MRIARAGASELRTLAAESRTIRPMEEARIPGVPAAKQTCCRVRVPPLDRERQRRHERPAAPRMTRRRLRTRPRAECSLGSIFRVRRTNRYGAAEPQWRSEEHTSELQSRVDLVCRLLLEKKKK